MKIGIDANCLSDPHRTGIGRYAEQLLRHMLQLDRGHSFHLYAAQPPDGDLLSDLRQAGDLQCRHGNFPSRYLWQQLRQGQAVGKDHLDVYLGIDGLLPLGIKQPSVVVVHDLIWKHYPHTTSAHIRWLYKLRLKPCAHRDAFNKN